MNPTHYRPEIDGLRGIAVLSVIVHHLSGPLLPGGFIGVDIFFVISGYLITSQIYKESLDSTFSLKRFYKRRINRIAPALVTVIVASLIVGALLLSPHDISLLAQSTIYAMLGLSNVFFWRKYGNYFSENTTEAPLLHTWSLGVEEQFYLVWPLFILLLIKLRRRRYIVGLLAILTVGAIAVSEIAVGIFVTASYYLLPPRFFELMIGGLLAIAFEKQPNARLSSGVCVIAGLVLIGASLFFLNKRSVFPGINALWPCLGAALLIFSGNTTPLSRILNNRPMVFIGLISYSLYLWHWPIIAYLNYMSIAITPWIGVSVVFSSILLAWLSWLWVEVPMRQTGATLPFSHVLAWRFAMPFAAVLSIGGVILYTHGLPARFDPRVAALEMAMEARPDFLRIECHASVQMYATPPNKTCRLGRDKPSSDGILIGDSYANHYTGMVDVMAKAQGISIMDYTLDACPPILGYDEGKTPAYGEMCRKRNEFVYKEIAAGRFSRVVLAASWPRSPEAGEQLLSSISAILKAGATPTIVLSNAYIKGASRCPIRQIIHGATQSCEGVRKGHPDYFSEVRSRYPTLRIIDPNEIICSGEKCHPVMGDVLLYRDDGHLNDFGSRLIGESFIKRGVIL